MSTKKKTESVLEELIPQKTISAFDTARPDVATAALSLAEATECMTNAQAQRAVALLYAAMAIMEILKMEEVHD